MEMGFMHENRHAIPFYQAFSVKIDQSNQKMNWV